jgi:osmoprotectant transport system permease protein
VATGQADALLLVPPGAPVPSRVGTGLRPGFTRRLMTTPIVLALLLLALYLWVQSRDLDIVEDRTLTQGGVLKALAQHLQLVGLSSLAVLAIAVPLGILVTRPSFRRASPGTIAIASVGQTIPSFGVIVLFALTLGFGSRYVIYALILSTILPVLSNTIAGLQQIEPALKEAASGVGMTPFQVLTRIELPLAVPVLLAGLRTSIVLNVGTATVAAFTGAGGLGSLIVTGLVQNRDVITVVGGALTAILALALDHLTRMTQELLTPRGL